MSDRGPKQMDWPRLYRVTLRGVRGEVEVTSVESWFGEYKAVAMAVEVHHMGWTGPKKTWPVYSVEVEDVGLAPVSRDGTVGIPAGFFDDRDEF